MRRNASQENPSEDVANESEDVTSEEAPLDADTSPDDDGSDDVTVEDLKPRGAHVRYIGRASQRDLDIGDWPIGVDQGLSASWGFHNNFEIESSKFTEDQLNYLLNVDGSFVLVE